MKNNGLSFTEWLASNHNPLRGSSQVAQHFTRYALQAAFEAGQLYQRRANRDQRKADRTDNFSFEGTNGSE